MAEWDSLPAVTGYGEVARLQVRKRHLWRFRPKYSDWPLGTTQKFGCLSKRLSAATGFDLSFGTIGRRWCLPRVLCGHQPAMNEYDFDHDRVSSSALDPPSIRTAFRRWQDTGVYGRLNNRRRYAQASPNPVGRVLPDAESGCRYPNGISRPSSPPRPCHPDRPWRR